MMIEDVFVQLVSAVRGVLFYVFVLDVLVLFGLMGALICRVCDGFRRRRQARGPVAIDPPVKDRVTDFYRDANGRLHLMPKD